MSRRALAELLKGFTPEFVTAEHWPFDPKLFPAVRRVVERYTSRQVGFRCELHLVVARVEGADATRDAYRVVPAPEVGDSRAVFWRWFVARYEQAFAHPLDASIAFVGSWRAWVGERW